MTEPAHKEKDIFKVTSKRRGVYTVKPYGGREFTLPVRSLKAEDILEFGSWKVWAALLNIQDDLKTKSEFDMVAEVRAWLATEARSLPPETLIQDIFDTPLEPARWTVDSLIPENSTVGVYGPPGAAKSFLALDIAFSIATGSPALNEYSVENSGPILYLAGEGVQGLRQRVAALQRSRGRTPAPGAFQVLPTTLDMTHELETILRELSTWQNPPRLIVIDTLARYMIGEENSAADMGRFIAACDRLRSETGASVLIVHHSPKGSTSTARGSGAFRGALDVEILMEPDGNRIKVSCTKSKEGPAFPDFHVILEDHEIMTASDGSPIMRGVLRKTFGPDSRQDQEEYTPRAGTAQAALLEAFEELYSDSPLSMETSSPLRNRTSQIYGHPLDKTQWQAAHRELTRRGILEKEGNFLFKGRSSKITPKVVVEVVIPPKGGNSTSTLPNSRNFYPNSTSLLPSTFTGESTSNPVKIDDFDAGVKQDVDPLVLKKLAAQCPDWTAWHTWGLRLHPSGYEEKFLERTVLDHPSWFEWDRAAGKVRALKKSDHMKEDET